MQLKNSYAKNKNGNKAVYTVASVADGWAGAAKVKSKKKLCDGCADGLTDRWTDGPKSGL